jgi:hypothetical protein
VIADRPWIVSQSASLLAQRGLLPRLRAACLTLASADESIVRSTTLSMLVPGGATLELAEAVRRVAEEHCVRAEETLKPDR